MMMAPVLFLSTAVIVFQCTLGTRVPSAEPDGGQSVGKSLFEDLPILVPNIGNVNGANLTDAKAEKFLKLWQIFVLSGKVVLSDEPWTLLVPLNEGLPRDRSFLADKDFTRNVLLNHAILGDVISLDSATVAGGSPYYSLADSELYFVKKQRGDVFVNDIRLTGTEIRADNGVIYVIEKAIPLTQPEFLKFVTTTDDTPRSGPKISHIFNLVNKKDDVGDAKSVVETAQPSVQNASKLIVTQLPSVPESKATSKPTRFDKFRNLKNLNNGQAVPNSTPSTTADQVLSTKMEISLALSSLSSSSSSSPGGPEGEPTLKSKTFEGKKTLKDDVTSPLSTLSSLSSSSSSSPGVPEGEPTLQSKTFKDKKTLKDDVTSPLSTVPNTEAGEPVEEYFDFSEAGEFVDISIWQKDFSLTFVESMLERLNRTDSMGSEFVSHFMEADLGKYLSPDKNYTAIIPTDDAFYDYYPIDWGFNPFLVENFTKEVLLNHILEGDIHLQEFKDDVEIHTIAGRVIKVIKNKAGTLLINGVIMPTETEAEINNGRLYYIHQLLFVDYDRVNDLRLEYPFLETAPLLSFPWPFSPFLSHLLKRLQEGSDTKIFAQLLRNSNISHHVVSSDENLNRLTYSAFVPTDGALTKTFGMGNLAVLEKKAIDDFLLEHIVPGYLLEEDFEDGFNLLSLTNTAIPIRIENNDIFVGPAKINKPQQYLYNLGTIFTIDKPFQKIALNKSMSILMENLGADVAVIPLKSSPLEGPEKDPLNLLNKNSENIPKPPEGETNKTPSVTGRPKPTYEVRTEISFSRQINDGEIVPVSRDVIEKAKSLMTRRRHWHELE